MTINEMKEIVYQANMELVRRGLVILTWGNVSLYDPDTGLVVIKPRGIGYDQLEARDMSVVDLKGRQVEKGLLPSVDLEIHLELYKTYPQIRSIAHTHSTYATAWAQTRRDIPAYGTTHADHFYGPIPCTRQLTPEETLADYEKNTGKVIVETFAQRGLDPMQMFGVLAAGHGPFTWGESAELAVENSQILEELAKMSFLTQAIFPASPLLEQHILDKHFLRKHGPGSYFYQTKET